MGFHRVPHSKRKRITHAVAWWRKCSGINDVPGVVGWVGMCQRSLNLRIDWMLLLQHVDVASLQSPNVWIEHSQT